MQWQKAYWHFLGTRWNDFSAWPRHLIFGLVIFIGSILIDWPPLLVIRNPVEIAASAPAALVFPLGYVALTQAFPQTRNPSASRRLPDELMQLVLGLYYGGAMWLGVTVDLMMMPFLLKFPYGYTGWGEVLWQYFGAHSYDLFALAAIVGAVVFVRAKIDLRWPWRIFSLIIVLALAGALSGLTEAATLDSVHVVAESQGNWILIILWALTGTWFGLIVGLRDLVEVLSHQKHAGNEANDLGHHLRPDRQ